MYLVGSPFRNRELEKLKIFLQKNGLTYEKGIQKTVNFFDKNGDIMATGSLKENVLKCILVSPKYRGQNLVSSIVTLLTKESLQKGQRHLLLFTRPDTSRIFAGVGFSEVVRTREVVLMENIKDGIRKQRVSFCAKRRRGNIGCMILKEDDIRASREIIKKAAFCSDYLWLLILTRDNLLAVSKVTQKYEKDLGNILIAPAGAYLDALRNYSTYFISDKEKVVEVYTELFTKLFCIYYAMPLGLNKLFVGAAGLPFAIDKKTYVNTFNNKQLEVVDI